VHELAVGGIPTRSPQLRQPVGDGLLVRRGEALGQGVQVVVTDPGGPQP
jgi:hypothetical protein